MVVPVAASTVSREDGPEHHHQKFYFPAGATTSQRGAGAIDSLPSFQRMSSLSNIEIRNMMKIIQHTRGAIYLDVTHRHSRGHRIKRATKDGLEMSGSSTAGPSPVQQKLREFAQDVMETETSELYAVLQRTGIGSQPGSRAATSGSRTGRRSTPKPDMTPGSRQGSEKRQRPLTSMAAGSVTAPPEAAEVQQRWTPSKEVPRPVTISGPLPSMQQKGSSTETSNSATWFHGSRFFSTLDLARVPTPQLEGGADLFLKSLFNSQASGQSTATPESPAMDQAPPLSCNDAFSPMPSTVNINPWSSRPSTTAHSSRPGTSTTLPRSGHGSRRRARGGPGLPADQLRDILFRGQPPTAYMSAELSRRQKDYAVVWPAAQHGVTVKTMDSRLSTPVADDGLPSHHALLDDDTEISSLTTATNGEALSADQSRATSRQEGLRARSAAGATRNLYRVKPEQTGRRTEKGGSFVDIDRLPGTGRGGWEVELLQTERRREEREAAMLGQGVSASIQKIQQDMQARAGEKMRHAIMEAPQMKTQTKLTKGVETFSRLCERKLKGVLHLGLSRWKAVNLSRRYQVQTAAAFKIQMFVRVRLAWRRVKGVRQQRLVKERKRLAAVKARVERRQRAAVMIQKAIRGWLFGRLVLRKMRRDDQTSRTIQRYIRRIIAKRAAWSMIRLLRRKDYFATKIQSRYRTHLALRSLPRRRRQKRHRQIEQRLAKYDTLVETSFQQLGAAKIIQRWWRNHPWRFQELMHRAGARRRRAVVTIQKCIRIFNAKRHARRLRQLRAPPQPPPSTDSTDVRATALTTRRSSLGESVLAATRRLFDTLRLTGGAAPATQEPSASPTADRSPTAQRPSTAERTARTKMPVAGKKKPSPFAPTVSERIQGILSPEKERQRRGRVVMRAAVLIQCGWRRGLAVRKAMRLRRHRALMGIRKAAIFQRYLVRKRNERKRRRRRRAAMTINRNLGAWRRYQRLRNKAATDIQKIWRGFCRRRAYPQHRQASIRLAVLMQRETRGFLARRRALHLHTSRVLKKERVMAGKGLYAATLEQERKRQALHYSIIPDLGVMLELQRIFLYYTAAQGRYTLDDDDDKEGSLLLDSGRFIRFCNAMSGLLNRDFTARHAEKVFDNCLKEESSKGLHYEEFLVAVRTIANVRMSKVEKYGRFQGEDARLTKFIIETIVPAPASKRILERLDKAQHYPARARAKLLRDITTIQRVYRGSRCRTVVNKIKAAHQAIAYKLKSNKAAIVIQCMYRRWKARRSMIRQAQRVYEKCVDQATKVTYFYNPRSGLTTYDKPRLLAAADVRSPIILPEADRTFSILCGVCNRSIARRWCFDCHDYFCAKDFQTAHRKGKTLQHRSFETDVCIHCTSQVASRRCVKCKDDYCDTCFFALHRKGQLSLHSADWLTEPCATCHKYMARRVCETCGGLSLCKRCASASHEVGHVVKELNYRPGKVRDFEAVLEKERVVRQIEEEYRHHLAVLKEKARNTAAMDIQRVWRGYTTRKPLRDLLGLALRKNRMADDLIRNSDSYKLLDFFGKAPRLGSDTPMERVLKVWPAWQRPLVVDAVNGDWITSLQMLMEREEWQLKRRQEEQDQGNDTLVRVIKTGAKVWVQEPYLLASNRANLLSLGAQKSTLDKKLKAGQQAVNDAKTKAERENARKLVKTLRGQIAQLEEKKKKTSTAVKALTAARQERKGPDRLRYRVSEFRQYGRVVPCTLDAKQGNMVFRSSSKKALMLEVGARYRIGTKQHEAGVYMVQHLKERKVEMKRGAAKALDVSVYTNRDWMDESQERVPIYRLPQFLFHEFLIHVLTYHLRRSPLVQWPLALAIYASQYTATSLESTAANFDEDSPMRYRLLSTSSALLRFKGLLMRRYRVRYLETGRSIRLKATAKELAAGLKSLVLTTITKAKKFQESRRTRDPYELWEESIDKRAVIVEWKGEVAADSEAKADVLGSLTIDVDMPLKILREVLRRRMKDQLNEKNGEGFLFVNKEDKLPSFYEEGQRGRDIIVSRFNEELKEHEMVCGLMRDLEKAFVAIPFIKDYEPPPKEESPASAKSTDSKE